MHVVRKKTMKAIINKAKFVGFTDGLEVGGAALREADRKLAGVQRQRDHLMKRVNTLYRNIGNGVYSTPASGYHVLYQHKGEDMKVPCTTDLSLADAVKTVVALAQSGCDECEFFIEPF